MCMRKRLGLTSWSIPYVIVGILLILASVTAFSDSAAPATSAMFWVAMFAHNAVSAWTDRFHWQGSQVETIAELATVCIIYAAVVISLARSIQQSYGGRMTIPTGASIVVVAIAYGFYTAAGIAAVVSPGFAWVYPSAKARTWFLLGHCVSAALIFIATMLTVRCIQRGRPRTAFIVQWVAATWTMISSLTFINPCTEWL